MEKPFGLKYKSGVFKKCLSIKETIPMRKGASVVLFAALAEPVEELSEARVAGQGLPIDFDNDD